MLGSLSSLGQKPSKQSFKEDHEPMGKPSVVMCPSASASLWCKGPCTARGEELCRVCGHPAECCLLTWWTPARCSTLQLIWLLELSWQSACRSVGEALSSWDWFVGRATAVDVVGFIGTGWRVRFVWWHWMRCGGGLTMIKKGPWACPWLPP